MKDFIFDLQRFWTVNGTGTYSFSEANDHVTKNNIDKATLSPANDSKAPGNEITVSKDMTIDLKTHNWSIEKKFTISSTVTIKNGNKFTLTNPENFIFTDGKLYFQSLNLVVSKGKSFTYGETTYTGNSSDLTLYYEDSSGDNSKAGLVKDLKNGSNFTVKDGEEAEVAYTVSSAGLSAISGGVTKYYIGSVSSSDSYNVVKDSGLSGTDICFDKLSEAILVPSGALDISDDILKNLTVGNEISIIKDSSYATKYGTLTKISDTECSITNTGTVSSVNISKGLTVTLDKAFQSIPITVNGTKFTSKDSTAGFTVDASGDNVLFQGKNVSLDSGTIQTNNQTQTIQSNNYSIVADTASPYDGFIFTVNAKKATLGDIDVGEKFTFNNKTYTNTKTWDITADDKYIYTGDKTPDGSGTYSIDLDDLTSNMRLMIVPDNDSVLAVTSPENAVIVDSKTAPTKKYANINYDTDKYTFSTINGGDFSPLKTGKFAISISGAKFKVTGTSGDNFTVNCNGTNPYVERATAITLLDGTVIAKKDQTIITLGDKGKTLEVTNGEVTVNASNGTYTITADKDDEIKIGNDSYTVTGSDKDGMTFIVDSNGGVTLGGLDQTDKDSFTYGTDNYSVRGAGFIKNSSETYQIWKGNNTYSLTGGTVAAESLDEDSNWLGVQLSNNNEVTINTTADNAVIVDQNGFKNTYGTLAKNNSVYTLTKGNKDQTLSAVDLGDNTGLNFGAGLTGINITSGDNTLQITADDSTGGYQVTISSGVASVTGASTVSLISGKAQFDSTTTYEANKKEYKALSNSDLELEVSGENVTIGGLSTGESFSVDGTSYTLQGSNRFIKKDAIWNKDKIADAESGKGTVDSAELQKTENWNSVIQVTLSSDNVLTLDDKIKNASKDTYLVESTDSSKIYGTVTKDNNSVYVISTDDATNALTEFNTISIDGSAKNISIASGLTGKTISAAGATFNVTKCDDGFIVNYATNSVSVENASELNLTDGTLTVNKTSPTVTANRNTIIGGDSTDDSDTTEVKVTTDNDTVKIDDLGAEEKVTVNGKIYNPTSGNGISLEIVNKNVSVKGIESGDIFKIDDITFTKTDNGDFIKTSDDDTHYLWTGDDSETVSVSDLSNTSKWAEIIPVTNGVLSIDNSMTGNSYSIVDISNLANGKSVSYGTLEHGTAYTITASSNLLSEIQLTNVKAVIPVELKSAKITADNGTNSATFTVSTNKAFTADASASTYPEISDVNSITLDSGEISAATGTEVKVGSKTVVPVKGDMTVGIKEGKGYINNLNVGDSFTVDGVSYTETAAGLVDTKNGKLVPGIKEIYNLEDSLEIIAVKGTTLDISNQTTDALVYDSVTKPTTFLAKLTVGSSLQLTGESIAAEKIKTINIAKDTNLDVDFAVTVNTQGNTTINGQTYDGTGKLVVDSDGSSSTLWNGTVKLDSGTEVVTATNDGALEISNGSAEVSVSKGKFNKLSGLNAGESFTYDNESYTQSAVGLINGSTICEELKGSSIDIQKISSSKFVEMFAVTNGVIDLDDVKNSALVVDDINNPKKKFGNLTKSDSVYTLDFSIKAQAKGSVTVNGKSYNSRDTITLNVTEKSSTLYDGTVSLNSGESVTADKTITLVNGSAQVTAASGVLNTVSGLDIGESFTYDGKTYTQTDLGLTTEGILCPDITGTTIDLSKLAGANWTGVIAPVDGVINLDSVKSSAVVVDNLSNPTKTLGKLTKDSNAYTLDFAIQVKTSNSATVNGKSYTPSGNIILDVTAETSTLKSGTVKLNNGNVTTSSGKTVEATGSITVTASDDIVIGELDAGDTFTADGISYTRTTAGLFKGDSIFTDKLGNSVTLTQLNSDSWSNVVKISNDTLDVTSKLDSGLLVSEDLTKIYGTLTKSSDGYALTEVKNSNAELTAINVSETKIDIAPEFIDVPLSANDSTFSELKITSKLKPVTLDATGTAPALSNVNSFSLTSGKVQVSPAQTVTSDKNTLTATVGTLIFTADEISSIDAGDEFTLNGVKFKMTALGLLAGDKLVSHGFDTDTLSISELQTAPLIAPVDGIIILNEVKQTAVVVDDLSNPTKTLGTLTKDGKTYTLDFDIQVKTSISATVNGKSYAPKGNIVLDVTATTSTLKSGTVALNNGSVTTSSGKTFEAKGSITVTAGDDIVIGTLDAGDSFSIDDENYTVSPIAPLHDGKIWNGNRTKSYTASQLANPDNWSPMLAVPDGKLKVNDKTLADGKNVVLVDDDDYPTKIYGLLSKDDGEYNLSDDIATDVLKSVTIDKTIVNIDNDLSGVPITTISKDGTESTFTVIPSGEEDTFKVDSTGATTALDRVSEIDITKGKVQGGDGVIIKPIGDAEDVTVLLGNGNHTVGDEYLKIAGLKENSSLEVKFDDEGNISALKGMEKGSTVTMDGTTYTAPEDNTTLNYTEKDGWYFDDYVLDAYTVTIGKKGSVSVDPGVKFTDVVQSGMSSSGSVKLSADLYDTPVTINNTSKTGLKISDDDGTLIESLARDATVTIARNGDEIILTTDAGTKMTLTAEDYVINGAAVTTKGKTEAVATADGVELEMSNNTTLTVGKKNISGTGTVTLDSDGNIIVDGTIKIDGVTINSDAPVNSNIADSVKVTGDTQYQINVEGGKVVGLENIGGNVTISGLNTATVKTNAAGTLTADKSFTAGAGTTYTLEKGKIVAAQISDTISGDFSNGVTVNDNPVTVTGGKVTVTSGGDIQAEAGAYTVNGHGYTASDKATYHTDAGEVTGIDFASGNLTVAQDETNFKINDETLTLANNSTPVSLEIADGAVTSASGVNGSIDGLKNATVYDAGKATVNGKKINVSGSDCAAVVMNGETVGLAGIKSGATIKSAPDLTIQTSENGTYSISGKEYKITDADGSVEIVTDKNSGVSDINNFAGSISGAVGELSLNGKDFGSSNGAVTVATDGKDITKISGVKSGDSIGGDLDKAAWTLPEGTVTINDNALKLSGESSVEVSGGGKTITGLTKDASLKASESGVYKLNGKNFAAGEDTSFTVNRDGAYAINPNSLPVIESTPEKVVKGRGFTLQEKDGTASGSTVVVRGGANVTVPAENTNLIATSGAVTLQNYADNASVQTYEYTNTANAIIGNDIQFGDGKMTLCDATITFAEKAASKGATMMKLLNAVGSELRVGFTHTAGGKIDESDAETSVLLKGNYAAKKDDTQKSGGSDLKSGAGNDTLLIGGSDTADAGAGYNTIYITDSRLRDSSATIYFNEGHNRVVNFNNGYTDKSDVIQVSDVSELSFKYGGTRFTLNLQSGEMNLDNADSRFGHSADSRDDSYKLKISDGKRTYNTAVATYGTDINVTDDEVTELYYGDGSGVNFSEYSGAVSVNLNTGKGSVKSKSATFKGITKLEGGKGKTQLTGADGVNNTLIAGTGDGSLWSGSGKDLMVGKSNKTGTTTFYYLEGDGRDSITGFDFAASSDKNGDLIDITKANEVTDVWLNGNDVVMQINSSADDYLTLANAKGKDFRINNLIAQVDNNISYDGMANCYVANAKNATMTVGANMGNAQVWLNDNKTGLHGTYYLGDIKVLDAHEANGSNILAGNALDNVVIGGTGVNSIWGGFGSSEDTLIGGSGQNTFFFALENGNDIVQNAHDGDVIDLRHVLLAHVTSAEISDTGVKLELTDGSKLDVQSNASMEYRLHDGTYIADHATHEWIKK